MSLTTKTLGQTLLNGSKKIAIIAALFLTVGLSNSFANTITRNGDNKEIVAASFRRDFNHAELMSMEVKKDYTKVTFKLNNMILFAYYSGNGELMAVIRNILSSQLPIQLLMDLKQKYNNYWITDLFEMNSDGQTNYYITLQNADTRIALRSDSNVAWEKYMNL